MLVGREAEVGRLRAMVQSTASGQPQFMLLSGAAGTGKSALMRHTLQHLAGHSDYRPVGRSAASPSL